jgi:hypothetical protein
LSFNIFTSTRAVAAKRFSGSNLDLKEQTLVVFESGVQINLLTPISHNSLEICFGVYSQRFNVACTPQSPIIGQCPKYWTTHIT